MGGRKALAALTLQAGSLQELRFARVFRFGSSFEARRLFYIACFPQAQYHRDNGTRLGLGAGCKSAFVVGRAVLQQALLLLLLLPVLLVRPA